MKVKRLLAILTAAIIAVTAISGCSSKENTQEGDYTSTVVNTNSVKEETINADSAEGVSETFIKAVLAKDYKTILSCLGIEKDKSFVSESDIEFYLPRSSFADILDISYDEYTVSAVKTQSGSGTAICTVTITDSSNNLDYIESIVHTALNDENKWVVQADEFCNTNYTFRTVGGKTKVSVNGIELSDSLCTNKSADDITGLEKEYTLPLVGKKGIEVTLTSENYTYSATLVTSSNNEVTDSDIVCVPVDDENVTDSIKDIWNGLYNSYASGDNSSEALNYIASDADTDICSKIWKGFDSLKKPAGMSGSNSDYNMDICKQSSDNQTKWITDNKLLVYFDYELNWKYSLGNSYSRDDSMKRKSNIVLSYENNEYKIYKISDNKLLTWVNQYTKDW